MHILKKFNIIVISYILFISTLGLVIFSSDEAEAQSSYNLYDAVVNGYVSADIQGDYSGSSGYFNLVNGNGVFFGECIEMEVTSEVSETLFITVNLGRELICKEDNIQDMVVTKEYSFTLYSYTTQTFTVYAMCIDMPEDAPTYGVYYDIGPICSGDIYNVVSEISSSDSQDAAGQCALWGVTDSADGEHLRQYGASNNDLTKAQGILDAAGVSYNIEEGSQGGIPLIWIIVVVVIIVIVLLIVLFVFLGRKKRKSLYQSGYQVQTMSPFQPGPPVQTESHVQTTPNFCPYCGNALKIGVRFCTQCGHKL